jgi:hypothetical protein
MYRYVDQSLPKDLQVDVSVELEVKARDFAGARSKRQRQRLKAAKVVVNPIGEVLDETSVLEQEGHEVSRESHKATGNSIAKGSTEPKTSYCRGRKSTTNPRTCWQSDSEAVGLAASVRRSPSERGVAVHTFVNRDSLACWRLRVFSASAYHFG